MKFSVPAFFALSVALSPISLAFAFTAPNIDWQSRGNSLFGAYDDYMETLKKMSTVEPVGDNSGRPIFPTYNGLQSVKERAVGEGRFDPSAYSCGFLSGNNNGASLRTNVSSIDEGESVTTPSPAPLALFPDGPVPGNLEEITFSDTVPPNFTPETEEFIPTPLSLEPELTATNVNTAERSVNDKDSPLSDPFSWEEDVVATALLDTEGITERIMKRTLTEAQVTGAGGVSTWEAFLMNEENWSKLKAFQPFKSGSSGGTNAAPHFVTMDAVLANPLCVAKLRAQAIDRQPLDYDVLVCGGTLGIFFATALQLKGHRVCVLEAGKLRGREQEWNISMDELMELVKLGVLSEDDIDAAVKTEFPACRSGFKVGANNRSDLQLCSTCSHTNSSRTLPRELYYLDAIRRTRKLRPCMAAILKTKLDTNAPRTMF